MEINLHVYGGQSCEFGRSGGDKPRIRPIDLYDYIETKDDIYINDPPNTYFDTQNGSYGDKVTVHGDYSQGMSNVEFWAGWSRADTRVYLGVNKYADAGWYNEDEFEYVNRD